MVKVKVECQDCDVVEEFECEGFFYVAVNPQDRKEARSHIGGHHVDHLKIMSDVANWFFEKQVAKFRDITGPDQNKLDQVKFQDFLRSIGFETGEK